MPEVVDEPGARVDAAALVGAHLGQGVREGGVADRHQVERPPHAGQEVGEPLVDPQRDAAPDDRARDDVERELVGQLVGDQPVELVGRLVDGQHDALPERLGEGGDAVRDRARNDVLLLELAVRLEDDEGNEVGEVVGQVGADLGVRALGVAGDALQVLLHLGVVEDLEVLGRVDVPLKVVVLDTVLAVVGEELGGGLGHHVGGGPAEGERGDQAGTDDAAADGAPAGGATHGSPREGPAACGGSWRRVCLTLHCNGRGGRDPGDRGDGSFVGTHLSKNRARSARTPGDVTGRGLRAGAGDTPVACGKALRRGWGTAALPPSPRRPSGSRGRRRGRAGRPRQTGAARGCRAG